MANEQSIPLFTLTNGQMIPRYDLAPNWYEFIFHTDGAQLVFTPGIRFRIDGIGTYECIEEWRPGKPTLYKLVAAECDAAQKRLDLAAQGGAL